MTITSSLHGALQTVPAGRSLCIVFDIAQGQSVTWQGGGGGGALSFHWAWKRHAEL